MKLLNKVLWVNVLTLHSLVALGQTDAEFTPTAGPYMGQQPPGMTPVVFAPGMVSLDDRYEGTISFTPSLDEFYFGANNDDGETFIFHSALVGGSWTPVKRLNLTQDEEDEEIHPFVSPDGKRVYFTRHRPSEANDQIWYVTRTAAGWSEATKLELPMAEDWIFFPNQAANGDTYFFNLSDRKTYRAQNQGGAYPEAEVVDLDFGNHAFTSRSQDYLLLTARNQEDPDRKDNDIYVCFKAADGTWTSPVPLGGRINTPVNEKNPTISPDGKYLFFGRDLRDTENGLANIYWVSTRVIEQLRPLAVSPMGAQESADAEGQGLEGPYLGQEPPGDTAEVFAPGLVSTGQYELFSGFTPAMDEFYFVRYDAEDIPSMLVYQYQEGQWRPSVVGPRSGEPFITPDGQTMHLGKRYRDRTDSGWTELKSLPAPFVNIPIMRMTTSAKDTYYFDAASADIDIQYAPLVDGEREAPQALDLDLGQFNAHPWIAPDESYLIWDDQREEGYGRADIYISFRQPDGSWGPAINMGPRVNTERSDSYATITPDGKYLLFNRNVEDDNTDIYWVDASIIEDLRQTAGNFSYPQLEGPYLGQEPPGMVAEPFAPGIISTEGWEVEGVFAPGMKEFYYTTSLQEPFRPMVIGFRQEGNVWKKYMEVRRRGEMAFSPDGSRMLLGKGYRERVGEEWSERRSLGPLLDREDWGVMRLTASAQGTYVFDDARNNDVIRISRIVDGEREEPVLMGPEINSGTYTAHPFIAPDESYLIWDSKRAGGYGDSDLYISFRQADGTWGPAINMGPGVNSPYWDAVASVTPDGRFILFNRGMDENNDNTDLYWVDARIIEALRPR